MKKLAPWTDDEVEALRNWQDNDRVHPFTCPRCPSTLQDGFSANDLYPTNQGWRCRTCDYTQDWAHDFMFGNLGHVCVTDNHWLIPRQIRVIPPDDENHVRINAAIVGKDKVPCRDGSVYFSVAVAEEVANAIRKVSKEKGPDTYNIALNNFITCFCTPHPDGSPRYWDEKIHLSAIEYIAFVHGRCAATVIADLENGYA
jgi:hypothetical protein